MPKRRMIGGKTTRQRIDEKLDVLDHQWEPQSVRVFAESVGIAESTFTHDYKGDADRFRAIRDRNRPSPRRRSPVTRGKREIADLDEAASAIDALRARVERLTRERDEAVAERDKVRTRVERLEALEETNRRLRGEFVSLRHEMEQYLDPDQVRRIVADATAHAQGGPPDVPA